MVDQNQAGVQVNGQPVMGGNPYDLIDNKNQESNKTVAPVTVQNVQAEQTVSVVQQPAVNAESVVAPQNIAAPVQAVQQPVAPVVQQVVPQAKPIAEPGGFTKKLISFIAKISGQPDPQTGKGVSAAPVNAVPIPAGQAPVANVSVAKTANPFDSIMGGVTGFLDKVESKVESVAGIDLDAPINKPTAPVAPVQAAPAQPIVTPVEVAPVVQVPEVVAPVIEQPVVQESIKEEIKPEVKPEIKEEIKLEQKIEEVKVPVEVSVETPAVEAVKTEIDSVEKNENVSVNPMSQSQNIQFGESKSV